MSSDVADPLLYLHTLVSLRRDPERGGDALLIPALSLQHPGALPPSFALLAPA